MNRNGFSTCKSASLRKMIAYFLIFSHLWTSTVLAGGGEGEKQFDTDEALPIPARSALAPRTNVLEDYKRHFQAEGTWQMTDVGFLLKARGDVLVRDLTMDRNLCILTDGDVIFEGRSQLAGDAAIQARHICMPGNVKAQGYVRLWGDELVIDRSLTAEKGAYCDVKNLHNKGLFEVRGAGFSGTVHSWINDGKADLEAAQLKVQNVQNSNRGVMRTRGAFLLSGDKFENRGTIFTAGIHQLNLTNAYDDWGHLYVPSLFLLNASRIEFHSGYVWLQEAILNAATYLEVSRASHFNLRSDQGKCFLQLSSRSDLHYHGEITQQSASFPFTAYDEIWTASPKSVFLGQQLSHAASHPLAKVPFSLAFWDRLRPRGDGVVFHTEGHALDLGGAVSLTAGSVKKSVKGKLEADGLCLRAGYFTGDSVHVSSQNAFLENAQFSALCGNVTVFVTEQAHLRNTQLLGAEFTHLTAQSLTFENQSLLKSLMGSAWAQASDTAVVQESGIEAKTNAGLTADSVDASGLWMSGSKNQLAVAQDGSIRDALFHARESTAVSMGGDADISGTDFQGQSSIAAQNVHLQDNKSTGPLAAQARQTFESHNNSVQGDFAVKAGDVAFSGETKATNLHVDAEKALTNTGSIHVKEDMALRGDDVAQLGETDAGRDALTQAKNSYRDREESRDHAGRKNILDAPKTTRFQGERSAGELAYHRTAAKTTDDFNHMRSRTHAPIEEYDMPDADLKFTEDTIVGEDRSLGPKAIRIHARTMENSAHFKAVDSFSGKFDKTFSNFGEVDTQGEGSFEAEESLTNEGSMKGQKGLSTVTKGLLTHHGHASGGDKTLRMKAKTIDAAARHRHDQSTFDGDVVDVKADEDILADAAILRARRAALEAGRDLRMGAVTETLHSEEHESSFFGLNQEVRRRTWQEADTPDMACRESLSLKAGRRLTGEGALLSAPTMHLEGRQGIAFNELRLQEIEEVERTRAVFEIGGIDLLNPFEDGIPMPEASVKVGARHQVTRTTQDYGQMGGISAQNLTIRTDQGAEADLRGNHLSAGNVDLDTDTLRLGGARTSQSVTDKKVKATTGVAYVGVVVPAFSASMSQNVDSIQGMQDAHVQIGHLGNQRSGAQVHAFGVEGGINTASGEPLNLTVEHPQTIQSQSGFSANASMTGDTLSLGGGGRWGEKRATQESHFNTPANVSRTDIRHQDSDTRVGFSANVSMSQGQVSGWGGSLQLQDQSFAFDSGMFGGRAAADPNASPFGQTLSDMGEVARQARTAATMGANAVGFANLAGAGANDVSRTLNDVASHFGTAERVVGGFQQAERWLNPSEPQPQQLSRDVIVQDLMGETEEVLAQTQPTIIAEDVQEDFDAPQEEAVPQRAHPRRTIASRAPAGDVAPEESRTFEEVPWQETFLEQVIADRKAWYEHENRLWDDAAEQEVRQQVARELGGIEQTTLHEDVLTGGFGLVRQWASKGGVAAGRYVIDKIEKYAVDTVRDEAAARLADVVGMDQDQAQLAAQVGDLKPKHTGGAFGVMHAHKPHKSSQESHSKPNSSSEISAPHYQTSRQARRKAMRDEGIPTSQQPLTQTYHVDKQGQPVGRQFTYEVPTPGGGSQKKIVTEQTTDFNHGPHWEAGNPKLPERQDPVSRLRVVNDKSKAYYEEKTSKK